MRTNAGEFDNGSTLFDLLGEDNLSVDSPAGSGLPESSHAGRPMGASHPEHASGMADSPQSTEIIPISQVDATAHLGRVCQEGSQHGEHSGRASDPGFVGILGDAAVAETEPLHPRGLPVLGLQPMRATHLLALLNSTPLGSVINDRQLRRHRHRAGHCFDIRGRVDLAAYVAWLIADRQKRTARRAGMGQRVSRRGVLNLLRTQGYRCALSGRPLTPDNCALDHILAMSRGGANLIENAQVLHRDVNRAKGTLTNQEFVQLCREVVEWANRQGTTSG